jgi:hypothetical protein
MLSYIINTETITLVINGKSKLIPRNSANAAKIITELRKAKPDESTLDKLSDVITAVTLYSDGSVTIKRDGTVLVDGKELPAVLAAKLMKCYQDGVPYAYLAKCFQRLSANPSKRAVEELYQFLSRYDMSITPEGFFLGYKGVAENFMDIHSGKFLNKPGVEHSMPRNEVCDNMNMGCSSGFHVGSFEYATDWAGSNGHVMIVLVDPADVVSIPIDCAFQKLRTCKYKVVCESKGLIVSGGVDDPANPYSTGYKGESGVAEDENDIGFDVDDDDDDDDDEANEVAEYEEYEEYEEKGREHARRLLAKGVRVTDVELYFSRKDVARSLPQEDGEYNNTKEELVESYLFGFEDEMDNAD